MLCRVLSSATPTLYGDAAVCTNHFYGQLMKADLTGDQVTKSIRGYVEITAGQEIPRLKPRAKLKCPETPGKIRRLGACLERKAMQGGFGGLLPQQDIL